MTEYVIRRLVLFVVTLLGLSFLVFISVRLLPGDVADQVVAQSGFDAARTREEFREELGLDEPVMLQYLRWMGDVLRGDFGDGLQRGTPVAEDLKQRLPVTLELGLFTILIAVAVAVPIGVISAVASNSWIDHILRSFSVAMLAIPGFWIATLILTYAAREAQWTPPRYQSFTDSPSTNLTAILVPASILGISGSAPLMRFVRTAMLEVVRQDYMRTAQAKGLRRRAVILRHGVRNALLPTSTVIGLTLSNVIGGSIIFEQLFGLPGMGRYLLDAVQLRDYPQIQAVALILGCWVILVNLVTDISYVFIDPRVRY